MMFAGCKHSDAAINCLPLGDPQLAMQVIGGEAKLQVAAAADPSKDQIVGAEFVPLHEGDGIDLYLPQQGGHVSYLGARVTNLMSCGLTMRSSLFDIDDGNRVQYEERNTNLTPVGGMTAWGQPDPFDPSSYNNVPLCPDYLANDIVDRAYALEVSVTDRDGRNVKARLGRVVPRCREDDPRRRALCDCECRGHYYLGRCADFDGGAPGGPPDAATVDAR
jgi:hypothetical protein